MTASASFFAWENFAALKVAEKSGIEATDADVPRIHEGVTIRDNVFRNVRTRRLEAYGVRNLVTDITD